jgi:hypothetical protein
MVDRDPRARRARRRRARLLTSAYFFVYSVFAASLAAAIGGAVYLLGHLID